jgi:hypothetical protein
MSTTNNMVMDTIIASVDLSALQNRVVRVTGDLADDNGEAYGVLQNKPQSGEHATVAVHGVVKSVAGAAIAAGAPLSVTNSGFVITTVSGTGVSIGKNKNVAVGSGDVFKYLANFANGATLT